jgi:hypothetical protein
VRWALFVFPDIVDVAPTEDPDVLRVFYEGIRPYPNVWRVELRQKGFDVPAVALCRRDGHHAGPARFATRAPRPRAPRIAGSARR